MRANVREFLCKQENIPGAAEPGLDGTDALIRMREGDTWQHLVDLFETNEVQASSSERPQLAGAFSVDATISYILRASGSPALAPAIGPLLEACMMRQEAVSKMTIGAITSGPFVAGEEITGVTSSATANVLRDTPDGATEILVYNVVGGPFNGTESISGFESNASTTTSSVDTADGFAFIPTDSDFRTVEPTDSLHHVTCSFNQDQWKLTGRGMLANLQMQFDAGRPGTVTQRLMGGYEVHEDAAFVAPPPAHPEEGFPAPRFECAQLKLDGWIPQDIISLTLNVETNPELRLDAQNCNGGVRFAGYDKIAPTITLAPPAIQIDETNPLLGFDYWKRLQEQTEFPVEFRVGETSGGTWHFYADHCTINTVEMGAERSRATVPIELRCNGTGNDELVIHFH